MRLLSPRIMISIVLVLTFLSSCAHFPAAQRENDIQQIIQKANDNFYLDKRIWYQDIAGEVKGDQLILTGEAFFSQPLKGLERRLKRAGYDYEIVDRISYLPEDFPQDKRYAIVTASAVMGRYKPVEVKEEGTEMLYGEPVRLIRDSGPYYQVQSTTGYLGYVPKASLRPVDLSEWNQYHLGKQAVFGRNVELENGQSIRMGTRLPYLEDGTLLLADGQKLTLSEANYRIVNPALNPIRKQIIESGKQYLGLPYVWGGRSADGVDCSGFVMQSFLLNDIYLPRDTDEMANVGRIIGLPGWTDALLPGDLLFFTGYRRLVTHVAIYMGDDRVIHSLGKGVQIESLNPEHPEYSKRLTETFIFAKRIFE
jgi:hypothetical protein